MQKDFSYSCPEYLIAAIMGYEKPVVTWQMKHGVNIEIYAKHKYKSLTKRFHKNITYNDPGMTVKNILISLLHLIWKLWQLLRYWFGRNKMSSNSY